MDLFGLPALNVRQVYTLDDIRSQELVTFIESVRGVHGVYQTVMILPSGDTREQLFFSKLVEDRTAVPLTYQDFYQRVMQPIINS